MKVFAVMLLCLLPLRADVGEKLVAAARKQIGVTVVYDPAYMVLKYPGGDVPAERGVCKDVVVRAFREGAKMDLQKLLHEDMAARFSSYPKIWDLKKPDKNIDHRRVPNLQTYFKSIGCSLPLPGADDFTNYKPGDLVTCIVPPNLPHIMIVSDRETAARPLVIHNIGSGAREEDALAKFKITGHYRFRARE